MIRRLFAAGLTLLACAGCRPGAPSAAAPGPGGAPAGKPSVRLFVPCGMAGPYGDLEDAFNATNSGIELHRKLGNYVNLCDDVKRGARPDVLINLGEAELEPLLKEGLVKPADVTRLAVMPLALVAPPGNPLKLKTLEDLTRPEVKSIAVGDPSTLSLGRATKQALEQLGLWAKLEKKFILSPKAAFTMAEVAADKVDASIVYKSCIGEVHNPGDKPSDANMTYLCDVPADAHDPIFATACLVNGSPNAEAARKAIAFFGSPQNQPLFVKWLYAPLPKAAGKGA